MDEDFDLLLFGGSQDSLLIKRAFSLGTYRRFTKQDFESSVGLLIFRFDNAFYRRTSIFLEAISGFLFLVIRSEANAQIAWNAIENLQVGLVQVPGLTEHITSQLNETTCTENSYFWYVIYTHRSSDN